MNIYLVLFQLYAELNCLHITQCSKTKVRVLDGLCAEATDAVVDGIKQGREGFMVGDNIDLKTGARHERLDRPNKNSHHWFNTDFVFHRVRSTLPNDRPLGDMKKEKNYC